MTCILSTLHLAAGWIVVILPNTDIQNNHMEHILLLLHLDGETKSGRLSCPTHTPYLEFKPTCLISKSLSLLLMVH